MDTKTSSDPEGWFKLEMHNGIVLLSTSGLDGAPFGTGPEKILAEGWADALWPGSKWHPYLDTPRIRRAFASLLEGSRDAKTDAESNRARRRFPQVIDFKASIQRRVLPEEQRLEAPVSAPKVRLKIKRTAQLTGAVPKVLTDAETEVLKKSTRPNDPEIIRIRNKLRAGLGWPELNAQGREV